jgi:hypothetical protein
MNDQFTIIPSFSLEPNKLSTYNTIIRPEKKPIPIATASKKAVTILPDHRQHDLFLSTAPHKHASLNPKLPGSVPFKKVFKRKFHNFQISTNAHRTLKRKINWLYFLSKSKPVKTYAGKNIYNFKMAFITLTLPSVQKHPTVFITKNLFNQFLTEVRQRTKMENYVWRLEFQKNGNVHYHIATDTYLDYFFIKQIWNRILSNYGYIQPYTAKHKNMSLKNYNKEYNKFSKIDFSIIAKRYALGCKHSWKQPNSIDVKSVISNKSISNYISKYFSKDSDPEAKQNILDTPENSKSLRLWFCSRSLSKLNTVTNFIEAVNFDIVGIVQTAKKVKCYVFKWASVYYFQFGSFAHRQRIFLQKMLCQYAFNLGYQPSG